MNGFERMKERLTQEGWFVGWNLPCCQSCAWSELPDYIDGQYDAKGNLLNPKTGKKMRDPYLNGPKHYRRLDLDKVLFNHSQDCQLDMKWQDCKECHGEGCDNCHWEGGQEAIDQEVDFEVDTSVEGFICNTPDSQKESLFCFAGGNTGVMNLKAILPILTELGLAWGWDKTGAERIWICWEDDLI